LSEFHGTKEWIALASFHKLTERYKGNYRCVDCSTTKHLESDHVLAVSKYPRYGLRLDNLVLRCGPEAKGCNQKKGNKFYWSIKSIKLWVRYQMKAVLFFIYAAIVTIILAGYLYIDCFDNSCTITHAIQAYALDGYRGIRDFVSDSMRFLSSVT